MQRRLTQASTEIAKSFGRLSSGMRINGASDDAAGLAIASSLNSNSRILTQAIRNVNDGISVLNIGDSALDNLSNIVIRQKELAEQAANGSLSLTQRKAIDTEANALVSEYNRIVSVTSFNGVQLFNPSQRNLTLQVGTSGQDTLNIDLASGLARTTGDGTFAVVSSSTTPGHNNTFTRSVDLNGDGNSDVISALLSGSTFQVQIGNGDGSFKIGQSITGSSGDFVLSDINNDGKIDIVGAYFNSAVSVILGNGDGTFKAPLSLASLPTTRGVTAGDFNGDGALDIAVGNITNNQILIFNGNGDGTFSAAKTLIVPGLTDIDGLTANDLNEDGFSDLAAVGSSGVATLLSTGTGFTQSQVMNYSSSYGYNVVVGDFNHDGIPDITSSNITGQQVNVFLGNGNGTFKSSATLSTTAAVQDVQLADVNGDGITDILAGLTGTINIFVGNDDGTFANGGSITSLNDGGANRFALGDFNKDGSLDIVNNDQTNSIQYFIRGNTVTNFNEQKLYLLSASSARSTLTTLDDTLQRISNARATLGANQSRLDVALNNAATLRENYLSAESRIKDVDIASESANLTRQTIRQQAATAVLAQANQLPALMLKLLQ